MNRAVVWVVVCLFVVCLFQSLVIRDLQKKNGRLFHKVSYLLAHAKCVDKRVYNQKFPEERE